MMLDYALPALAAVLLWWLSTGIILYLDGLPRHTFRWSMAGASVLALAARAGAYLTRDLATPLGAYAAFTLGLVLWGWQAMSFYMGYITGPRITPCPPGLTGLPRFLAASETNITHEAAIAVGALLIDVLLADGANRLALATYLALWWMHLSGKLNVFLGVPNLSEEFIPDHLAYLRTYMTRRPMNLLFPVSVTASTLVTAWFVMEALRHPPGSFESLAHVLLATLVALAVLEHWLLVLPLPAMALWTWSLASRDVPDLADPARQRSAAGSAAASFSARVGANQQPPARPDGQRSDMPRESAQPVT